jgi:hypothetical protein
VCALANWSCRFVDPDCLGQSERRKRHDGLVREDSGVGIATEIGGLHLVAAAPQIATDGRASGLLVQTSPTHLYNLLAGGLFTEFKPYFRLSKCSSAVNFHKRVQPEVNVFRQAVDAMGLGEA